MQQIPAFRQKPVTAPGETAVRPSTERTICWWTAAISFCLGKDLRDLAQADFHAAQSRLMDILSDYQGIKGCISDPGI